jgi:hypothetical protein
MAATELLRLDMGVVSDYLINECRKLLKQRAQKVVFPFENHSLYFKLNRKSNQTANNRSTHCSLRRHMHDTFALVTFDDWSRLIHPK